MEQEPGHLDCPQHSPQIERILIHMTWRERELFATVVKKHPVFDRLLEVLWRWGSSGHILSFLF